MSPPRSPHLILSSGVPSPEPPPHLIFQGSLSRAPASSPGVPSLEPLPHLQGSPPRSPHLILSSGVPFPEPPPHLIFQGPLPRAPASSPRVPSTEPPDSSPGVPSPEPPPHLPGSPPRSPHLILSSGVPSPEPPPHLPVDCSMFSLSYNPTAGIPFSSRSEEAIKAATQRQRASRACSRGGKGRGQVRSLGCADTQDSV